MALISYVIRTKNEGVFLEETCKRIRAQHGGLSQEIIIVDSGSTDNTLEIARKYADQIIKIKPEDFSWGVALNLGIDHASGEIICILSGHCLLRDEFTIQKSVAFLYDHEQYCCLYGRQIGNRKLDKFECIELHLDYPDMEKIDMENGRMPGISNACCLLRKSVWRVHPFNEKVQSAEDALWCKEICKKGYKPVYFSGLCVFHGHRFSPEYIYRKWYWRVYQSETIFDRSTDRLKSNYIRFCLSFIRGMVKNIFLYRKMGRKLELGLHTDTCFKYMLIREYASFRAKIDLKKHKNNNIKYNQLKMPQNILRICKSTKAGEFYDI